MAMGRPAGKGGGNTKFDPVKKTGLLPSSTKGPRADGGGATYVMSGSVMSPRDAPYVSQNKKKAAEAKEKRTREAREAKDEEMLKKLLQNDNATAGAKNVQTARDYVRKQQKKAENKGKEKADESDDEDEEKKKEAEERERKKKAVYKPDMLKKLGFDPTMRPGDALKTKKVCRHVFLPLAFAYGHPVPGRRLCATQKKRSSGFQSWSEARTARQVWRCRARGSKAQISTQARIGGHLGCRPGHAVG